MGKCNFCGKDAGWFAHEHSDCRRRHDAEDARLARTQAEERAEQARRAREREQEQARLAREQAEEQARLAREQAAEEARLESEREAAEARRLAALPRSFADIVGQTHAVERLRALRDHALARRESVPHLLLISPDGAGKRTLAGVLANEVGSTLVVPPRARSRTAPT